jgi:MATE family multidrug resistance protein
MASWLLISAFNGAAGYTSTLVAHYNGANREDRIASTVWQGMYFSLITGGLVMLVVPFSRAIFAMAGHEQAIQIDEARYFAILCLGAPASIIGSALNGFFTGREDTKTIMIVQIFCTFLNIIGDWLLIFGVGPIPAMGVTGAGIATVGAQCIGSILLLIIFLRAKNRHTFGTWKFRKFNADLFWRLMKFGLPSGGRFVIEMLGWTMFLFIVGRTGTIGLTATNIAWRINGIAFFPIIGLSIAVGILVGNAQGMKRPDLSRKVTIRGLIIAESWMLAAAVLFVTAPVFLFNLFKGSPQTMAVSFDEILAQGIIILRYVALYCTMDAFNIILLGALQSAGDTRWTLNVSIAANILFLGMLIISDRFQWGMHAQWTIATVFVILLAMVWIWRFASGRWQNIKVIEPSFE